MKDASEKQKLRVLIASRPALKTRKGILQTEGKMIPGGNKDIVQE